MFADPECHVAVDPEGDVAEGDAAEDRPPSKGVLFQCPLCVCADDVIGSVTGTCGGLHLDGGGLFTLIWWIFYGFAVVIDGGDIGFGCLKQAA